MIDLIENLIARYVCTSLTFCAGLQLLCSIAYICSEMFINLAIGILNQWSLDFSGNLKRICDAIAKAKKLGSSYILLPELCISSYGCQDHFLELDTCIHSWDCLNEILLQTKPGSALSGILIDVGLPVLHKDVIYNCRVLLMNFEILLIRPKLVMANGGLHRESRWFTPWVDPYVIDEFPLPKSTLYILSNKISHVPFGNALLCFYPEDFVIGFETCEELWAPNPPHINLFANGAQVVSNASASHLEIRKYSRRIQLVESASSADGVYMYSNLRGCDSERVCYDGGALFAFAGKIIHCSERLSLKEVEVVTYNLNVSHLKALRASNKTFGVSSLSVQYHSKIKTITVHHSIGNENNVNSFQSLQSLPIILSPYEEISYGPALWLWDQLRRSSQSGFFLCLSGGIDSCSVALIVYNLCKQLHRYIHEDNNVEVKTTLQRLLRSDSIPDSPRGICNKILITCFMSTKNNSKLTETIANDISNGIGSEHYTVSIDSIYKHFVENATNVLNLPNPPEFASNGGSWLESISLQNVQARSRMVLAYLMAQLVPWRDNAGGRLVLSSANLDETLRGYLTKYDCSSADLNPIGCISKRDLRSFVNHQMDVTREGEVNIHSQSLIKALENVLSIPPSAELEPTSNEIDLNTMQNDETDMGITYAELSLFGRLRKQDFCGPYTMLHRLLNGAWNEAILREDLDPSYVATCPQTGSLEWARFLNERVKYFFKMFAINRHKATILPPSCHLESYGADDNRFDLRPFSYPVDFKYQFDKMDSLLADYI